MYGTAPSLWVRLASLQFSGPTARWLSSVQSSIRKYTWCEFSQEVVLRFGRNQHQSLIRRLYKLLQTSSVEEYVSQFSELIDQLASYEDKPDTLHYVTRFIDGLKPAVRMLVAVQLPKDLETAYNIALVQEEVGEGLNPFLFNNTAARRTLSLPHTPARQPEDSRSTDTSKSSGFSRSSEDKFTALKNYRRAKGLCFTCDERYSKEHKCQATVQLYIVQEMVEFLQTRDDQTDNSDDMELNLMQLDNVSNSDTVPECSIILSCSLQGKPVLFLLDSGSNNSFLSDEVANHMQGLVALTVPKRVKVAGGGILQCTQYIPQCL